MRFMKATQSVLLFFLLFSISCLTIDPPPPERLKAPTITQFSIYAEPDSDNEFYEAVKLFWKPDSTDEISIRYYELIRSTSQDSLIIEQLTNIPYTVTSYEDRVARLNLPNPRRTNGYVYYRIFAIDTLERAGDTSVICTVSLAEHVTLRSPFDTLQADRFHWVVPQIFTQTITNAILWKEGLPLWVSDSTHDYTGGGAKDQTKTIPTSIQPLSPGKYYWGVNLILVSGGSSQNPSSISIREFYVK